MKYTISVDIDLYNKLVSKEGGRTAAVRKIEVLINKYLMGGGV